MRVSAISFTNHAATSDEEALNEWIRGWGRGPACRGASVIGLLILVVGCHSGQQTVLDRISGAGHSNAARSAGLAEKGEAEITAECAGQNYKNAVKEIIVSETGLHEDVFALRDRVSHGEIAYGLDDALTLESLLEADAKQVGGSSEKTGCLQQFLEHLEALSDPLLDGDEKQKELDASAFQDSAKEAEEQAEKNPRTEKPAGRKAQPSKPQ